MTARRWLARFAVGSSVMAAAAASTIGACTSQPSSHIYVGRQYDPRVKCLGEDTSIDVVSGPEPMTPCPPTCVTSTFDEAGTLEVYVSSMCSPFPNYPWVVELDAGAAPECVAALAAWSYDTTCEDGGVIINVPDAAVATGVDAGDAAAAAIDASDAASE